TISYDEAMELFKLPRTIGQLNNEEVTVNTGRFGPYVKYGELFVNLPRSMDPMVVTMDEVKTLIEAKLDENAPIGYYKELPITKGKGRFGPFVKWNDMFINIPVRFKLETITVDQAIELIDLKVDKEANRYVQQWPSEKISIENGRWGPYLKFGKNNLKLPKKDGQKIEDAYLQTVSLEEVKSWIEAEIPDAFKKKESPKKASTAKPGAKKK
ncbi:MAG: DNA topoisomerase I, partial [Saprospiraceae bacterium]|nr:DNA topoisomerase I [Saprospiraceae bacterium]